MTRNLEHFQYVNFKTSYLKNENFLKKTEVPSFN